MVQYPQEGIIRVRWTQSGEMIDADRHGLGYGLLYLDELEQFIRRGGKVVEEHEERCVWTLEDLHRIRGYYR
jgi:hypothetical protein